MEYIQLTNEHCVHHYGLIQNPKNRNTLLMYSQEQKLASFPIITDESIVTVLNIQGEFAYVRNECPQGIQEYNDKPVHACSHGRGDTIRSSSRT